MCENDTQIAVWIGMIAIGHPPLGADEYLDSDEYGRYWILTRDEFPP